MTTIATFTFKVTDNFANHDIQEFELDFFHLDVEIMHAFVDSVQVLSFDKDSNICVAELFSELSEDELESALDDTSPMVSLNMMSLEYETLSLKI